jgi:hypothetical protein
VADRPAVRDASGMLVQLRDAEKISSAAMRTVERE